MKLRVLGAKTLRRVLPMPDTIATMKSAFAAFSSGGATVPQRLALEVPPERNVVLVKPALLPGEGLGAKLVSIFPGNSKRNRPVTSGVVILLDEITGEPAGLCDGTFLTAWRTGAASGAATDLLAREGAASGALIGCGAQGRTQLVGIDAVRQLETIRVFDHHEGRSEQFAEEMSSHVRARVVPVSSAEEAVDGADVICTATTSLTPVIDNRWVRDGAHINGVGSFTSSMKEVGGETIARSSVFVDSRASARTEAGELIAAVEGGLTSVDEWIEIGEVVCGARPGRQRETEVTFFKSVGLAVQDIATAAEALRRAAELGLGELVDVG